VGIYILNAVLATILIYLLVRRVRKDQEDRPGRRPPD
jgi:hypothetical protein